MKRMGNGNGHEGRKQKEKQMIISTRTGKKITANQLAKEAIADRLDIVSYFMEGYSDLHDKMTEKEQSDYRDACDKKIVAVLKYLGVDEVGQKVEPSYWK